MEHQLRFVIACWLNPFLQLLSFLRTPNVSSRPSVVPHAMYERYIPSPDPADAFFPLSSRNEM